METTTVAGVLAPGRSIDTASFADITPATVSAVTLADGVVLVTFATTLTGDVVTRVLARISLSPAAEAAHNALDARVAALENGTS